jgi:exodeoxyribonuclease-5
MAITEVDLTVEQKECIDDGVRWWKKGLVEGFRAHPTYIIDGPAGAGKSELGRFLLRAIGFDPASNEVGSLGPTGKSAMVLRNKGMPNARTIHSGIYSPAESVADQVGILRAQIMEMKGGLLGKRGEERDRMKNDIVAAEAELKELRRMEHDELRWDLNPQSSVARSKVVLCDEGSQVGGALKDDLESFGVPIIYLADSFQLPPIDTSSGSVCFDVNGRPVQPDFRLTKIHRQAEGSAIIRYSRDLREGKPEMNFYGKEVGEDGGILLRLRAGQLSMDQMSRAEQIICGFNETRIRANGEIRRFMGRKTDYPEPGDKLICLKNNKDLQLVNGMTGVSTSFYFDYNGREGYFKVDVELEDGREIPGLKMLTPYFQYPGDKDALYNLPHWATKKYTSFDFGNVISCHKCVTPDTIVHTSDGIFRIGELNNGAEAGHFKPLRNVDVFNGVSLEEAMDFFNNGVDEVLHVTTRRGVELFPTPEHGMLVLAEGGLFVERRASELRVGDFLPVPRATGGFGIDRNPLGYEDAVGDSDGIEHRYPASMTPALAEFLGMVVAGGSVSDGEVSFRNTEWQMANQFSMLAGKLFGCREAVMSRPEGDFSYGIHSARAIRFIRHFGGVHPDVKDVPQAVLRSGNKGQRAFLRGMVCGGSVNVKEDGEFDYIGIEMGGKFLFEHVRAMFHNFGVIGSRRVGKDGRLCLAICAEYAEIFETKIGFCWVSEKKSIIQSLRGPKFRHSPETFPFLGEMINKILLKNEIDRQEVLGSPAATPSATLGMVEKVVEVCRHLQGQKELDRLRWLYKNFTFDMVERIEDGGKVPTVCLRMKRTGRFVQNGLVALNSQGSQYRGGVVLEEGFGRDALTQRRWRYTAATRFEMNLIIEA